ncbi:hypothetical protein RM530_08195 [Algiphilus sp. W345]|uniref:Cellulose biosynthesis protein BcsR n=1 Tax=Banduia mediterranea TaxID=3075609 RepID=A0ABU2WHJ5_9GAMM|nr:hypothetical protein [Algiphilus sp. W345]MDT0497344.1 hypothetical protein [Algiphilus sp. W345]
MSDQGNDDIKQLYGHLGLDPRSYREIRDDRAENPEAGKSGDWSLLRAVRSRLDQGAPAPQAPPAASPTIPPPDARPDSAQQASFVPQVPQAARVEPTLAPTPVAGRESLAASLLASLKAYEVDHAAQRAASPAAAEPEPMGAEHTRSEAPPAQAAAEPGASQPPVASPEDGRSIEVSLRSAIWPSVPPSSPAQPAAVPEPPTAESAPPPAPGPEPQFSSTSAQPPASSLMRGISGGLADGLADGLVSTFRRLEAPRPLTNPDLARLRLNYGARSEAHGVSQPRDANLREVFARLKRVGDDH